MITLRLAHLYPKRMNIYGDRGNITALRRRCEWRDITLEVQDVEVGTPADLSRFDLFFFGGGQDQQQGPVATDILARGDDLREALAGGAALLAVCGGYQLLGRYYQPATGERFEGLGVFPAYTEAGPKRLIGDVVSDPSDPRLGEQALVGFENHSGLTWLDKGATPLGTVRYGRGNNGQDGTEGCIEGSAVGTYLHGSLLPKNPPLADWLLARALTRRFPDTTMAPLADTVEIAANQHIVTRYQ